MRVHYTYKDITSFIFSVVLEGDWIDTGPKAPRAKVESTDTRPLPEERSTP